MLKLPVCRLFARRVAPGGGQSAKAAHIRLGQAGEEAAVMLLTRAGFTLLDRNWRQGRLELDMVCRDGREVVFVEVKTRRSDGYGGPAAAVTPAKQRALARGPGLADGA